MEIRKASRAVAMDRARSVNPALFDRMIANTNTASPDQCWTWCLSKDRDGYGSLKVSGKNLKAHKVMHSLFYPQQAAPVVRHLCNNPACVNPIHLRGGTQKENAADRVAADRGGNLKGENNGRSKLSALQVHEIRNSNDTGASLARKFGVSKVLVCSIRRGSAWSHITTEGE